MEAIKVGSSVFVPIKREGNSNSQAYANLSQMPKMIAYPSGQVSFYDKNSELIGNLNGKIDDLKKLDSQA